MPNQFHVNEKLWSKLRNLPHGNCCGLYWRDFYHLMEYSRTCLNENMFLFIWKIMSFGQKSSKKDISSSIRCVFSKSRLFNIMFRHLYIGSHFQNSCNLLHSCTMILLHFYFEFCIYFDQFYTKRVLNITRFVGLRNLKSPIEGSGPFLDRQVSKNWKKIGNLASTKISFSAILVSTFHGFSKSKFQSFF